MVQKSGQLELPLEIKGETLMVERSEQTESATCGNALPGMGLLLEKALERPNLLRALRLTRREQSHRGRYQR